jgi:predicted dinucleotide-binding enzyme
MKTAIIGTGAVGSALTRACRRAGHEVVLGSRHTNPLGPAITLVAGP